MSRFDQRPRCVDARVDGCELGGIDETFLKVGHRFTLLLNIVTGTTYYYHQRKIRISKNLNRLTRIGACWPAILYQRRSDLVRICSLFQDLLGRSPKLACIMPRHNVLSYCDDRYVQHMVKPM